MELVLSKACPELAVALSVVEGMAEGVEGFDIHSMFIFHLP